MTAPTPHNEAKPGDIAPRVLLPGDPLRAKFIAENFLSEVVCHNKVRNMLGYTGTWKGLPVSVQGTGMGQPSISIYVTELFRFYGVKDAIRVGSCGSTQPDVRLGDIVIAMSASTTSGVNHRYFNGIDFAPTANFDLLSAAARIAKDRGMRAQVGPILSSDSFYDEDVELFDKMTAHGMLGVEMEAAALYTIAARDKARALCLATVSDHIAHHEVMTTEERQTGFSNMVELALATLAANA